MWSISLPGLLAFLFPSFCQVRCCLMRGILAQNMSTTYRWEYLRPQGYPAANKCILVTPRAEINATITSNINGLIFIPLYHRMTKTTILTTKVYFVGSLFITTSASVNPHELPTALKLNLKKRSNNWAWLTLPLFPDTRNWLWLN